MIGLTSTKIVTTRTLRKIVGRSEKGGLSRLPSDQFWKDIDSKGKHVLRVFPMPGEYRFVRTFALCKMANQSAPAEIMIDICSKDWKRIRSADVEHLIEEANG